MSTATVDPTVAITQEGAAPVPLSATKSISAAADSPKTGAHDDKAAGSGQQESPNIRQLRETYERTKAELEAYSKLGKPDELGRIHGTWSRIAQEAQKLAGGRYTPESIQAALAEDPIGTLQFLREEAGRRQSAAADGATKQEDVQEQIKRAVAEQTAPMTEYLNRQMTDAAVGRFDQAFDQEFKVAFPDTDLPKEVREALYDLTGELLKYDEEALNRLKLEGKTSDVKKYFEEAKNRMLAAFNAWSGYESKRAGGTPDRRQDAGATKQKPVTLDDMIADPGRINPKYA